MQLKQLWIGCFAAGQLIKEDIAFCGLLQGEKYAVWKVCNKAIFFAAGQLKEDMAFRDILQGEKYAQDNIFYSRAT